MMTPYNGDITQSLKWMHNNAPNIQSLVNQKSNWYHQFQTLFWSNWQTTVFDLRTAGAFGLYIWCVILGVPSQGFGLYPQSNGWAFGNNRQNYIWNSTNNPSLPNPNVIGGNFSAGGGSTILNLNEVRLALKLRYVALVSNGRIQFINKMLAFIFNNGQPWTAAQFAAGYYFYVTDSTMAATQSLVTTPPVTTPLYLEYRIGKNMGLSAQFVNLLNTTQYGIVPTCAGSSYLVVQETV
jgi:hypothetical protein